MINKNIKLKYMDFGIAYAYDRTIELNKELKKHPKLMKKIIKHEREHIKYPSFLSTLKIDFLDMFNFKKQREMRKLPFMMKFQSTFPIWIHKGQFNINLFSMTLFSVLMLLIVLSV